MLYTFVVSISIPDCKSIAHFLKSKMGCFLSSKAYQLWRQTSIAVFVISRGRTYFVGISSAIAITRPMETPLIPCAVRAVITSLILFSFELSWFDLDRDAYTTTQSCWHPFNPLRSYRARTETENWNQGNGPVSCRSLPINFKFNQSSSPLSLVLSCTVWSRADCMGASKIVLFLFNTGVSTTNFQPHQNTL